MEKEKLVENAKQLSVDIRFLEKKYNVYLSGADEGKINIVSSNGEVLFNLGQIMLEPNK